MLRNMHQAVPLLAAVPDLLTTVNEILVKVGPCHGRAWAHKAIMGCCVYVP
jgi:hypothetical protein